MGVFNENSTLYNVRFRCQNESAAVLTLFQIQNNLHPCTRETSCERFFVDLLLQTLLLNMPLFQAKQPRLTTPVHAKAYKFTICPVPPASTPCSLIIDTKVSCYCVFRLYLRQDCLYDLVLSLVIIFKQHSQKLSNVLKQILAIYS